MKRKTLTLLIITFSLVNFAAGNTVTRALCGQNLEFRESPDSTEISLEQVPKRVSLPPKEEWKSLQYTLEVGEKPGSMLVLEESPDKKFVGFNDYQSVLRIYSGHEVGLDDFYFPNEDTDYHLPEGIYKVNVTKTDDWRGTVTVTNKETGEEFPTESEKFLEESFVFNKFMDEEGSFEPREIVLNGSLQDLESYRDIKIDYKPLSVEKLEEAPENSIILVEPEFEKTLFISTLGTDFKPVEKVSTPEKLEEKYSKIFQVGEVDNKGLDTVKTSLEVLRHKFFPEKDEVVKFGEDREEKLFAAKYALEKGKPLTKTPELEETLIKPYKKGLDTRENHITLADVQSSSSALAPKYSKKHNASLIVTDSEKKDFRGINSKLKEEYDKLVEKRLSDTLTDQVFLTNFGTPKKTVEDPVEKEPKVLEKDEMDNETVYTEKPFTDLDGDGFVDVNYGRIPSDLQTAYKMLEQEVEEEKGVVAASYMHQTWPKVLANLGGGLTYGINNKLELQDHTIPTTLLVENRTSYRDVSESFRSIVTTIKGLPDPVDMKDDITFVKERLENREHQEIVEKILSDPKKMAKILETALNILEDEENPVIGEEKLSDRLPLSTVTSAVGTAEDGVLLLKSGLEHKISFSEENLEEFLETVENPESVKQIEKDLAKAFLKQRPPLTEEKLEKTVPDASKMIYIGESNETHWHLPNEATGRVLEKIVSGEEQYNGTENFQPKDFNGFLIDTSHVSARPGSEIKQEAFRNGSRGLLGFTGETHYHYAQQLVQNFLRHGYHKGTSFRKAFNKYKENSWTFDPENAKFLNAYWRTKARRNKTLTTFTVYGPPERQKDPVTEKTPDYRTDCSSNKCNHTWEISLDHKQKGNKTVVDGGVLENQEIPNIYFKKLTKYLPEGKDILDSYLDTETVDTELSYADNITDTTFPKKEMDKTVRKVPEREKIVVKVPVVRNVESSTELVEGIEYTLVTDKVMDLGAKTKYNSVIPSIVSDKEENGTIKVEVGNRSEKEVYEKEVKVDEGENSFTFSIPDKWGDYTAKVFYKGSQVLGPEVVEGEVYREEKKAVVGEPKEVRFENLEIKEVNSPNHIQKTFLEPFSMDKNRVSLSFFKQGSYEVEFVGEKGSKNITFNVEKPEMYSEERSNGYWKFKNRYNTVIHEVRDSKIYSEKRSERGVLTVKERPGKKVEKLETKDFVAERVSTPIKVTEKVVTRNGIRYRLKELGVWNEKSSGLPKNSFINKVSVLDNESEKLAHLTDIKRSG